MIIWPKPTASQFRGCLLGQCLGDALGFPVEGQPREVCEDYVASILGSDLAGLRGRGSLPFGQYTDDSQLARELLDSLVTRGGMDPPDYARRIAAIFRDGRIVGRGAATEKAAQRLIAGVPWEQSGTAAPSAGNGTAMRAAPIGLWFWNDLDGLRAAAHDQGRITHLDPRCSAGSVLIAAATAYALAREPLDTRAGRVAYTTALAQACEPYSSQLALLVSDLHDVMEKPLVEAAAWLRGATGTADEEWREISPFVIPSVLWSVLSFLRSPDDYWETICFAIAAGGDVDTTAAMAGAISGARLGDGALPVALVAKLTDQGTWGATELAELADRAHAIATI